MDEVNFIGEIVPAVMLCVPALVMNEAAGMGDYPENPDSNKTKRSSAYASSRGAICVIPLSFAAWIIGMTAVQETNLSLYSVCSVLNLILGIVIIIAHTLGNDRARHLLWKLLCCCSCEKRNPNAVESTPVDDFDEDDVGNWIENKNQMGNSMEDNNEMENTTGNKNNEDEIDLDKMIRDSVSSLSGIKNNANAKIPKSNGNEDVDLDEMIRDSVSRI